MKIGGTHFSEEEWVCCHSNLPSSLEDRLEWSPQSPGELPWSSASGSSIQGPREDHSHLRALGTGARLQDSHVTTDPSHAHSCPCSPGLLGQVAPSSAPACPSSPWALRCHVNTVGQLSLLGPPKVGTLAICGLGFARPSEPSALFNAALSFAALAFELINCTFRMEGSTKDNSQGEGLHLKKGQSIIYLEQK